MFFLSLCTYPHLLLCSFYFSDAGGSQGKYYVRRKRRNHPRHSSEGELNSEDEHQNQGAHQDSNPHHDTDYVPEQEIQEDKVPEEDYVEEVAAPRRSTQQAQGRARRAA